MIRLWWDLPVFGWRPRRSTDENVEWRFLSPFLKRLFHSPSCVAAEGAKLFKKNEGAEWQLYSGRVREPNDSTNKRNEPDEKGNTQALQKAVGRTLLIFICSALPRGVHLLHHMNRLRHINCLWLAKDTGEAKKFWRRHENTAARGRAGRLLTLKPG